MRGPDLSGRHRGSLYAFDAETGRQLWKQNIGTIQKASVVFADGKIYIGSEAGKFYIVRPHADKAEVLSEVEMPISDQGLASQQVPEPIVAGAAVARGRVYFVSSDGLYALGRRTSAGMEANSPGHGAGARGSGLAAGIAYRVGSQTGRYAAVPRTAVRRGSFLRKRRRPGRSRD